MSPQDTRLLRSELVALRLTGAGHELDEGGMTWRRVEAAVYAAVMPTHETHGAALPEKHVLKGLSYMCHVMVHVWSLACDSLRIADRIAQASSPKKRLELLRWEWGYDVLDELVQEITIAIGGFEGKQAGLWEVQYYLPNDCLREDLQEEGRYMPVPSPLEPPDLVPCPITREIMAEIVPDDPESSERLRERIERIHCTCQAYIYEFEHLFDISGQTWAARYASFLRTLGLAVELMGLSLETILLLDLVHSSLPREHHKKQLELDTARLKAEERLLKRKRRSEGSQGKE
jgi:hypothetical protein